MDCHAKAHAAASATVDGVSFDGNGNIVYKPRVKAGDFMVNSKLLIEVKENLRVTWDEGDAQIKRLIETAMSDINSLFSRQFDYSKPGRIKILLLAHVFYSWNNMGHEFRDDYKIYIAEVMQRISIGEYDGIPTLGGGQ